MKQLFLTPLFSGPEQETCSLLRKAWGTLLKKKKNSEKHTYEDSLHLVCKSTSEGADPVKSMMWLLLLLLLLLWSLKVHWWFGIRSSARFARQEHISLTRTERWKKATDTSDFIEIWLCLQASCRAQSLPLTSLHFISLSHPNSKQKLRLNILLFWLRWLHFWNIFLRPVLRALCWIFSPITRKVCSVRVKYSCNLATT